MALILIFAGSVAGMCLASFQMLFQDATFWQGLSTYVSFSVAFPVVTGILAFSIQSLRTPAEDRDDFGLYNA